MFKGQFLKSGEKSVLCSLWGYVSVILFLCLSGTLASAQTHFVSDPNGATSYYLDAAGNMQITNLPYGSALTLRSEMPSNTRHIRLSNGEEQLVSARQISTCRSPNRSTSQATAIQACLQDRGFSVGALDGDLGPASKRALQSFIESLPERFSELPYRCQLDVPCADFSTPNFSELEEIVPTLLVEMNFTENNRWIRRNAKHAYENAQCDYFKINYWDQYSETLFFDMPLSECFARREAQEQFARYEENLNQLECEAASNYPNMVEEDVNFCFEKQTFETAKINYDCDLVGALQATMNELSAELICRNEVERMRVLDEFERAFESYNCDTVLYLEDSLGRQGSFQTCVFNKAMASNTARQMFLAAGQYDANDARAEAKLLYAEIVERFPEDDLALQAVSRLTSINDLERSEQARRDMEAERARADAERRAAATANANQRYSICGGRVSVGYGFPYSVEMFGVRLPQGDAVVIGINPNAQTATVRYMPASGVPYTSTVRCSAIR